MSVASDQRLLLLLRGVAYATPLDGLTAGPPWEGAFAAVVGRWAAGGFPPDAPARLGLDARALVQWMRALAAELRDLAAAPDPLGVLALDDTPEPAWEAVRERYRALSLDSHPDRHPRAEHARWASRQKELNLAWTALRDPARLEAELAARRARLRLRRHFLGGEGRGAGETSGGAAARPEQAPAAGGAAGPHEPSFGHATGRDLPHHAPTRPIRASWAIALVLVALGVAALILMLSLPDGVEMPLIRPGDAGAPGDGALRGGGPAGEEGDHRAPDGLEARGTPAPRRTPTTRGEGARFRDPFDAEGVPSLDLEPATVATPRPGAARPLLPEALSEAGGGAPGSPAWSGDGADDLQERLDRLRREAEPAPGATGGAAIPPAPAPRSAIVAATPAAPPPAGTEGGREGREARLGRFLVLYARAYETEDLVMLRGMFHPAVVQNGEHRRDEIMERYERFFRAAEQISMRLRVAGGGDAGSEAGTPPAPALEPTEEVTPEGERVWRVHAAYDLAYVTRGAGGEEAAGEGGAASAGRSHRQSGRVVMGLVEAPGRPGGFRIVRLEF